MRKITSLFALFMLIAGTAVAQITSLSQTSNTKCYTFTTSRSTWAVASGGTQLSTIATLNLAYSATDTKQQFAVITPNNGINYYLWSVEGQGYVTSSGALTTNASSCEPVYLNSSKVMYFNSSKYINIGGSNQITIDNWSSADAGNILTINEAADFDPTDALAVFATSISVTYNLYESDGTTLVSSVTVSQEKNSAVSVPTSMVSTYYDNTVSGTIGETDCTITVVRTLKAGIVGDLANLSNNKSYYITTRNGSRSSLSTYADNGTNYLASPVKSDLSISAKKFAIISYEGNYYLYSVDDAQFVTYSASVKAPLAATITGTSDRVTFTQATAPLFVVKFDGSDSKVINSSANYTYGVVINSWGSSSNEWDDGCLYTIHEADDFDPTVAIEALDAYFHPSATVTYVISDANGVVYTSDAQPATVGETISSVPSSMQKAYCTYTVTPTTIVAGTNTVPVTVTYTLPFTLSTDYASAKWYYMTLRGHYVYYSADNADIRTNQSSKENTAAYQWAFLGNPYSGIKVMNNLRGDGYYMENTSSTVQMTTTDYGWTIESLNGTSTFGLKVTGGTDYINEQNHSNHNLIYWSQFTNDTGSQFTVEEVPTDAAIFDAAIAQLESYPYGTGLNQYSLVVESVNYTSMATSIISSIKDQGYTAENLAAAQQLLAGTSLNMPATGKAYRFKANATGQYIGTAASGKQPLVDAANAGTYIYTSEGYLLSYDQGRYLSKATGNAVGALGGNGVAFSFYETGYSTPTLGTYRIRVSDNSNGSLIAWTDGYLNGWGAGDNALCEWTIEEVTELPVTISAAGQATVCLPVAWEVPAGLTVRYATTEHDGLLTVEDATATTIAAGEPVIIVGAAGTYNVTIVETADALTGNLLTGTGNSGVSVAAETKAYVLALNGENKVVFSLLNDSERNIEAFKAYYISTAAGEAPTFFLLDEGDVTGINAVNAAAQNGAAVYDLQGRRVSNAQKGVYIINGQKVLVK